MLKFTGSLFFAAAVLVGQSVKADIIKCTFTEPFISTEYSMAQQTLTVTSFELQAPQVTKNVSFQIKGAGEFVLMKEGKVLQKLSLDFKGSDGMSDIVYPYSVVWSELSTGANSGLGGCDSNFLKRSKESQN